MSASPSNRRDARVHATNSSPTAEKASVSRRLDGTTGGHSLHGVGVGGLCNAFAKNPSNALQVGGMRCRQDLGNTERLFDAKCVVAH